MVFYKFRMIYLSFNLSPAKKISSNTSLFLLFSLLVIVTASFSIHTSFDFTILDENLDKVNVHDFFSSLPFELSHHLHMFPEASAVIDTWTEQTSGVPNLLVDVSFINSTHGWVVGNGPTLIHTVNGGTDWDVQTSCARDTSNLNAVHFVDSNTGWVGGSDGQFCNTTDGGATWLDHSLPNFGDTGDFVNTIYFINSTHGWTAGGGEIYRTTDGTTWTSADNSNDFQIRSIHFADIDNGWAVGHSNSLSRTSDGGQTWSDVDSGLLDDDVTTWLGVHFTDSNTGWIVGSGGIIRHTTDGGTTWVSQDSGDSSRGLQAVDFVDSDYGWAVALNGRIRTTDDGGSTQWQRQDNSTGSNSATDSLYGLHILDLGNGWAVGENGAITRGSDNTVPVLANATVLPTLDLNTGTLSIVYDDFIDHTSTTLSGITITDSLGANGVSLEGATLSDTPSKTFTLTLTPTQKFDIDFLASGSNTPLQIDVTATAIKDFGGNSPVAISNTNLTVTADSTAPRLVGSPVIDFGVNTLTLVYDEIIDVVDDNDVLIIKLGGDGTPATGIVVHDINRNNAVGLDGATIPNTDSNILTISMTFSQKDFLTRLYLTGNALYIDTDQNVGIQDTRANKSDNLVNVELTIIPDTVSPTLIVNDTDTNFDSTRNTTIDLGTGEINFVFDEQLNFTAYDPSKITITDSAGANGFTLDGAETLPNFPSADVQVILTESQRQSAKIRQNGNASPIQFDIAKGAFQDLNGNEIAPINNIAFTVAEDDGAPTLVGSPVIDFGVNTLTLVYDEIIDVVDDSDVLIFKVGGDGTAVTGITLHDINRFGAVGLAGAMIPKTDSNILTISLTPSQKVFSLTSYFSNDALYISTDQNVGIQDTRGNKSDNLVSVELTIIPDTVPPTLIVNDTNTNFDSTTNTTIDLGTGEIRFVFNEQLNSTAIDPSKITITDSAGENGFTLDGAETTPNQPSAFVQVILTESQRQSAIILQNGTASPIQFDIAKGGFRDTSQIEIAPINNIAFTVALDDDAPTLDDATPDINLVVGTVTFDFNELIDVSEIDSSEITITDNNDANPVSLVNATLPDNNSDVVVITMTDDQIELVNALNTTSINKLIKINVTDTAIKDISGANFAGLDSVNLTIVDTIPPTLAIDPPELDLGVGTLTFDFDEDIDVSEIDLSGITITDSNGENAVSLDGSTLSDSDSDSTNVIIDLTPIQRQAIIVLAVGLNPDVEINVPPTVFSDLTRNSFVGLTDTTLSVTADGMPPILSDPIPILHLDDATLFFDFNEYIDVSEIVLSEITITDSNGENGFSLDGATLPVSDSGSVTITLTESQRQEIVILNVGVNLPVQIDISDTAITDTSGNNFVDNNNPVLDIRPDATAPELNETSIDLSSGTMTFDFNEYIDVSEITLSGITITDSNGENAVSFDNAIRPDSDSGSVTITLTPALKQKIIQLYDDSGSSVQLDITATAISDLSENNFVIADDHELNVIPDTVSPVLDVPLPNLDLGTGILTLDFDEFVVISADTLSDITITDSSGTSSVSLANATLPDSVTDVVTIELTSDQKHDILLLEDVDETLQINIPSDLITDTSNNNFAGFDNSTLTVIPDEIPPVLNDVPYIGLLTGIISFEFDEFIDVSEIDSSKITITDSNGDNKVVLSGDVLPVTNSDIFTIPLTEDQRQVITLLHYDTDNTPIKIDILDDAISDISGNDIVTITGNALTINTDLPLDTWETQTSNVENALFDVHFIDSDNGWTVGASGTIIGTTNGGMTWIPQTSNVSDVLYGVHFVDSKDGWAVGENGQILTTNNGGIKWNSQRQDVSNSTLNSVHFVDQNIGWTVGDGGIILATINAGETWNEQTNSIDSTLNDVHFLDLKNGWAAGDGGRVIAISDGGTTSQTTGTTNNLTSIHFLDSGNGWAAGDNGIVIATTDGGTTWTTPQTTGTTVDLSSIHFIDSNNGWTVGKTGLILATVNGGTTWSPQISNTTENLLDVHLSDPQNAWAVGNNGVILHGYPSDAKPPLLIKAEPILDLNGSTLTIDFDKTINVSAIQFSDISITDSNGENAVALRKDRELVTDSADVKISLTESQRQELVVLNVGANNPVQINITATAIRDTNRDNFAGLVNAALEITPDTTDPLLDNLIPVLNLSALTLSFDFNEYIDVSKIDLSKIIITDSNGENPVNLEESILPETDSDAFEITLTTAQNIELLSLYRGENTPIQISIGASTIVDLTGNNFTSSNVKDLDVILSSGGGGRSSSPPSFTTSFDSGEETIMINNVGIAPQPFKTDYTQSVPIQMSTDKHIPFSFTLYDNESWKNISHLELCINKPVSNNLICDSDTKIIWDKNTNDGTLELVDPNGMINSADFDIAEFTSNIATFNFDIVFKDSVNTTDLQIYVWDNKRDSLTFTVRNAFVVVGNGDSSSSQNNNEQSLHPDTDGDSDTRRIDIAKNNNDNTDVNVLNENKSCAPGKLLLDDGTCMDPEPGTFTCLPDQIMHSDNTCNNVPVSPTIHENEVNCSESPGDNTCNNVPISPTSSVKSLDRQSNQKMIASMWAGYHSDSATDAQLLNAFDIKPTVLPTWVKSNLGSWVAQDKITLAEFESALQYVNNPQINS